MNKLVIAVDGPSASGKSTICDILGAKLNINHLSSGALYRAIALFCKQNNIDFVLFEKGSREEVKNILNKINLDVKFNSFKQQIFLNGEDVTNKLNTNEISLLTCKISPNNLVREKVKQCQQKLAKCGSIIIDGRDITSVVLKDCKNKFFVTASVQVRAKRRYEQYNKKISLDEIEKDLSKRDFEDTNRKIAPLKIVEDAIIIDSSNLTISQTVDEILKNIKYE